MFALAKIPPPARDWYDTASLDARQEYDAFGPWVYAVSTKQEMPPRFRDAWPEVCEARFVLKLPIKADRRDVRPGMVLYTMILAAGDAGVKTLQLAGERIDRRTLNWDAVVGISSFSDLLDGRWALLLRDGNEVAASYNCVSAHHFAALGDFVRQQLTPDDTGIEDPPMSVPMPIRDLFYRNQARTVRTGSGSPARVLHSEPRDRFCRDTANRSSLSTGLLVLDAGDGLVIVDRGAPTRRFFHPTYAARQVFVPYRRLTGFTFIPTEPDRRRFGHLVLCADRQSLSLACLDRPDGVMTHLAARGVPSRHL